MLQLVTRRVTFRSCGARVGKSRLGDFGHQDVGQRSSRAAEKPLQFSPPDIPPFLSKLLGKTSKLQIFPRKLRRNGQKWPLILRRLQRPKNSPFLAVHRPRLTAHHSSLVFYSLRPFRYAKSLCRCIKLQFSISFGKNFCSTEKKKHKSFGNSASCYIFAK